MSIRTSAFRRSSTGQGVERRIPPLSLALPDRCRSQQAAQPRKGGGTSVSLRQGRLSFRERKNLVKISLCRAVAADFPQKSWISSKILVNFALSDGYCRCDLEDEAAGFVVKRTLCSRNNDARNGKYKHEVLPRARRAIRTAPLAIVVPRFFRTSLTAIFLNGFRYD